TLSRVLEKDGSHLAALLLLARIESESGDPILFESAKEHLLQGARHGLPVLHEVMATREAKGLALLRDDPRFILAILRAPLVQVDASKGRDPFLAPWRWVGGQPTRDADRTRQNEADA